MSILLETGYVPYELEQLILTNTSINYIFFKKVFNSSVNRLKVFAIRLISTNSFAMEFVKSLST